MCIIMHAPSVFLPCLLVSAILFSWYSLWKAISATGDNCSSDYYLRSKTLEHFPHWA